MSVELNMAIYTTIHFDILYVAFYLSMCPFPHYITFVPHHPVHSFTVQTYGNIIQVFETSTENQHFYLQCIVQLNNFNDGSLQTPFWTSREGAGVHSEVSAGHI